MSFGLFLEFIPSANRGRHSIILQSAWTVGALVEAALAWIILPIGHWRALLLASTMPLGKLYGFKDNHCTLCCTGHTWLLCSQTLSPLRFRVILIPAYIF